MACGMVEGATVMAKARLPTTHNMGKKIKKASGMGGGNGPAPSGPAPQSASEPQLSEATAVLFARLCYVGCPVEQAMDYLAPSCTIERRKVLTGEWAGSELVKAKVKLLIGGNWMEMTPEQRYRLALDKSDAEMAFYLHTNSFVTTEHKEGVGKIQIARQRMREILEGVTGADDNPMHAMARFMMDYAREKQAQLDMVKKTAFSTPAFDTIAKDMQRAADAVSDS